MAHESGKEREREWLTVELAEEYRAKARSLPVSGEQDIGERRRLRR